MKLKDAICVVRSGLLPLEKKYRRNFKDSEKLKVSVDAGFKKLKVSLYVRRWKDGWGKRFPVSKSHIDKLMGKCVCSVNI